MSAANLLTDRLSLNLSFFWVFPVSLTPFRCTFMYEQFPEVMNMLWARMLRDNKKNWRRVYKVCSNFS